MVRRIRQVPIERQKLIEVPLETTVNNVQTVEKIIEQEVEFETIIEKRVEYIVEKVVQVPVEKIIEVPINIYITKPIIKEIIVEEEVPVEINIYDLVEVSEDEEEETIDDVQLNHEI